MAIITISRELAALGDETAKELVGRLRYRLATKQTLEDRIRSYGVEEAQFKKYDERKPSFFASLSPDHDDYLHYLKAAILAEATGIDADTTGGAALSEGCIIMGRGAGAFFRNTPGILSVFLVAPQDIRVERVKSYFHCDEKHARQIIDKSDQGRAGFHRSFFDTEWKDPDTYHLTLNTGRLHPAACADLIIALRDRLIDAEGEERSALRLRELALAQQVIHHIVYERGIRVHFLEANVSGEVTCLYGVANAQTLVEAAISTAKEVPGVETVRAEIQVVQEYAIMP